MKEEPIVYSCNLCFTESEIAALARVCIKHMDYCDDMLAWKSKLSSGLAERLMAERDICQKLYGVLY